MSASPAIAPMTIPAIAPPEIEESLLVSVSVSEREVEVAPSVEVTVGTLSSSSVGVAEAVVSVELCQTCFVSWKHRFLDSYHPGWPNRYGIPKKRKQNKTLEGFHTVDVVEDVSSESVTVIVTAVVENVVEVGVSSVLCTVVKSRTKIGNSPNLTTWAGYRSTRILERRSRGHGVDDPKMGWGSTNRRRSWSTDGS